MSKYTVRIEATHAPRPTASWISIARRGRQSVESQCFALIGYAPEEMEHLTGGALENARDALTLATRLMSAFEYIPEDPSEVDSFFEKKILGFEQRLDAEYRSLPRLHAVIGIAQATRVLFATSGDMLALQITPTSIVNLAEVGQDGPLHFETFRSGLLNQQSLLLCIPKNLGTLLKSDELKNLHSAKSSERKLEYLEHIAQARIAGTGTFSAILLEAKPKMVKTGETTAVSIAHLLQTESNTEDLLSPPLLRPIMQRLKTTISKTSTKVRAFFANLRLSNRAASRPQKITVPKPRLKPSPKSAPMPETPIATTAAATQHPQPAFAASPSIRTLSSSLMHISAWGKSTLTSKTAYIKTKIRFAPASLLARLRAKIYIPHSLEDMIARFNVLPRKSKLLLLLVLLLIFGSAQSVLLTMRSRAIVRVQTKLQDELTAIKTSIDSANAALIYTDEGKARLALEDAKTRIANFPAFQARAVATLSLARFRTEAYVPKTTLDGLTAALIPIQEGLRHAVAIESPAAVSTSDKNAPKLTGEIPTGVQFHKRLYSLSPAQNQILRHEPKKGGGFDEGRPWLTDGSDLHNMKTLTIDGTIFATDGTGAVTALLKGKKTDFALKPVDPALTQIRKLWTNEDSKFLYVLDPQQKRLVVFNKKDGTLKAQYTSPKFTDLKDFAIDEHSKLAYLLDGATTLSIPLSHFGK